MQDKPVQKPEQTEPPSIIEEKISKVNGDIAIKQYALGKLLGQGGFAKCYEVTNLQTNKVLAAQIIPKNSLTRNRARQKLISEIKIHQSLHQQHVVQFEHVFEDHDFVYILLEICTNQTLNELIKRRKRLTELQAQCYVLQIISSLQYLHSNRVIHRDLKLGNLFLNEQMELKLGDFGLATQLEFEGEKQRTICGTPNYIAPEILDSQIGHSYEVDIWSLGVIIYTLLIGKPPYETPDVQTTYKQIKMNNYSFPDHVPISEPAKSLVTQILNLDPTRRPTLDEILAHSFLNNGGTVPQTLPLSTLACPPSASYIKQFTPMGNTLRVSQQPTRLVDASPAQEKVNNFGSTDQLGLTKPLTGSGFGSSNQGGDPKNWGMVTSNNWGGSRQDSIRPMTQKSDIKPSASTQNLPNVQTNPMLQTMANLPNMQSVPNMNNYKKPGTAASSGKYSEVWVKQWVDYSSKYGLGYLLSNGSSGVYFNDSTKIVLDPTASYLEYLEKKGQDKQDAVAVFNLNDYPKDIQQQVTLLQHFRGYLQSDTEKTDQANAVFDESSQQNPLVYVKKWMQTRHAIMFRLSNQIVQVNFNDQTEILLSSENQMVTYVNQKGQRSNFPLATALQSTNTEMAKRLQYTQEILTHMLNQNQAQPPSQITQSNSPIS